MRSRWPATRTSRCARSSACSFRKAASSSSVSTRRACGACASIWVVCADALARRQRNLFLPSAGEFIGYRRLRDWLRLLSFEVEAGRFGCYLPPFRSEKWLARFGWMEGTGDRWWPVFGAVYFIVAVKRVRGMRLVGLVRDQRAVPNATPAPATVRPVAAAKSSNP